MRLAFMSALSLVFVGCAVQPNEDIDSLVDEICCGATCCLIGGTCFTTGEANPEDACEVCDPGSSRSAFTNMCDAGAPADAEPEGDSGPPPMMDSGPMDDAGGDPDAGEEPDAGGDPDAGSTADAGGGTDAGDGGGGGGGCSVASGSQNVWLLAIGIVALIWRRRRLS